MLVSQLNAYTTSLFLVRVPLELSSLEDLHYEPSEFDRGILSRLW